MIATAVTLACVVFAPPQEPPPDLSEPLARLAVPADRASGAEQILACDPEASVPALVACIVEAPPAHAWQAMRVLRKVVAACDRSRDRMLEGHAGRLAGAAADASSPALSRQVRVLAVGALGRADKQTLAALQTIMDTDDSDAMTLASCVALAQIGKPAARALAKSIDDDRAATAKATMAIASLGAMGADAGAAKAKLRSILNDREGSDAWLLAYSTRNAMNRIAGEKLTARLWEKRRKETTRRSFRFPESRLDFSALTSMPELLVFDVAKAVGVKVRGDPIMPGSWALPTDFEGRSVDVGDGCRQLLAHIGDQVAAITDEVRDDRIESDEQWTRRLQPVERTWDLMRAVFR